MLYIYYVFQIYCFEIFTQILDLNIMCIFNFIRAQVEILLDAAQVSKPRRQREELDDFDYSTEIYSSSRPSRYGKPMH